VLDKLVEAALRPSAITQVVTDELRRLEKGGFLSAADVEKLAAEAKAVLGEKVEHTRATVLPLLGGVASSLREALDLPSRAEVLALTEALRRAEASRAEGARSGTPPAP
jgi:hypothetical protein